MVEVQKSQQFNEMMHCDTMLESNRNSVQSLSISFVSVFLKVYSMFLGFTVHILRQVDMNQSTQKAIRNLNLHDCQHIKKLQIPVWQHGYLHHHNQASSVSIKKKEKSLKSAYPLSCYMSKLATSPICPKTGLFCCKITYNA